MAERDPPPAVSTTLRTALLAAAEAGVSRYRVAKETGVSQAALSRFANARQNLDLASVDKLAAYLGMVLAKAPAAGNRQQVTPNLKL